MPWRLTSAGRAWLRNWVARPVTPSDVARDPAAVDLRLALLGNIAPRRLPTLVLDLVLLEDE